MRMWTRSSDGKLVFRTGWCGCRWGWRGRKTSLRTLSRRLLRRDVARRCAMKFGSRLVSFDPAPGDRFRPISTPIYQTATFEQEHADEFGEYDYSRSGNPTRAVLENHLASLENGIRGFCFSSGMAAITTVTKLLSSGDDILADSDLYGGTCRLFSKVLKKTGITARYADACN